MNTIAMPSQRPRSPSPAKIQPLQRSRSFLPFVLACPVALSFFHNASRLSMPLIWVCDLCLPAERLSVQCHPTPCVRHPFASHHCLSPLCLILLLLLHMLVLLVLWVCFFHFGLWNQWLCPACLCVLCCHCHCVAFVSATSSMPQTSVTHVHTHTHTKRDFLPASKLKVQSSARKMLRKLCCQFVLLKFVFATYVLQATHPFS